MESFLYITLLMLLGMALRRRGAPEHFANSLNFFIINVSLPAMVVVKIPQIHFDLSALWVVLTPWLLMLPVIALVLVLTRHKEPTTRAALLLVVPLGNTSFVGIPIVDALLGSDAIPYVLMYDQFGTFLLLSLYGSAVIARYESGALHHRVLLKKVLLFPPFAALIFALGFGSLPQAVLPYLQQLSDTLVPLALVSVGYALHFRGAFDVRLFSKALGIKLLLMPLMAFIVLHLSGSEGLSMNTTVLEAGMPPMITAGALAMASGFAPQLVAALVGYGIFISLITLPLIHLLLGYM